ncbi:MAG: TasA family protein [Solirubrobacteraceae bacterium]
MTKTRKITLSILIVGLLAGVAGFGAFSAFSATTSNTGNSFASGTVAIGDNDGGSTALYTASNKKPGDAVTSCIRVTYTGTLGSAVKLYTPSTVTNGTLYNIKVERGTQTTGVFPACGDFAATSTAFDAALSTFPITYATGLDGKAAAAAWATSDVVAYRFTVTQNDDTTANAHTSATSSGSHDFTWEARNN